MRVAERPLLVSLLSEQEPSLAQVLALPLLRVVDLNDHRELLTAY